MNDFFLFLIFAVLLGLFYSFSYIKGMVFVLRKQGKSEEEVRRTVEHYLNLNTQE